MPSDKQDERWVKQAEAIDAKVRQKYAADIRQLRERLDAAYAAHDELVADVRLVCEELRLINDSRSARAIEVTLDTILKKRRRH
jgi:hypothetical protein